MRQALFSLKRCRVLVTAVIVAASVANAASRPKQAEPGFITSDRCVACHNDLKTTTGEDVSIGYQWRASVMANSSRDPYWQASVRREITDHPNSQADIEDICSTCHMPIVRYEAKLQGQKAGVFSSLAAGPHDKTTRKALDGVSCSVCHQIGEEKLGKLESFSGGFVVDSPNSPDNRPVYGPYDVERGASRIMRSSSEGYNPKKNDHIRQSELCATCHTLYNKPLSQAGKPPGEFPEQMPYLEWLHSEYKDQKSCQSCHMPAIKDSAPITGVLGELRQGSARHVFVGGNFLILRMLNRFRDDLRVGALPQEMETAAATTTQYLQSEAARLKIENVAIADGRLQADVIIDNLGGHKLPTGYPARRVWLHVTVRDGAGKTVFESGALHADGSIQGNSNDRDETHFEPHYDEIRSADQVQIYESILGDANGGVTTGLLTAVRYLKDNRLLPHGFDKTTAVQDIAVIGGASTDSNFTGSGDRVRYSAPWTGAGVAYEIEAEALYQPIGYRWANNLKPYPQAETQRFSSYYSAMTPATAVTLARAVYQSTN